MPTTSTPSGTLRSACHFASLGSSRWQCGHQWARYTTSVASDLAPPTVTGVPSKLSPDSVGAVTPSAGSAPLSGNAASGVPVTVTGWVCSSPTVEGSSDDDEPLLASTATIAAAMASAATMTTTSQTVFDGRPLADEDADAPDDDDAPDGERGRTGLPDVFGLA